MRGRLLLAQLLTAPVAVLPARIPLIVDVLMRADSERAPPELLEELRAANADRAARGRADASGAGSIAVVPIYGYMTQRPVMDVSGGGGTSTIRVGAAIRAALADDSVASILLDIDSPGGEVFGVQELGDQVARAATQKPVVAIANSLAASAAYWVGSQAGEFYVAPGGVVGSIGVYTVHEDLSRAIDAAGISPTLIKAGRFKAEANPWAPLSDDDRAAVQKMVESYYSQFVAAVARGRRTTVSAVRSGYGEGRALVDQDAVAAGLVDGIRGFNQVVGAMRSRTSRPGGARSAIAADASEHARMMLRLKLERDRFCALNK